VFHTYGEDVDICLRLTRAGYRIVYTPEAKLYHHRRDTLKSLLKMIHRWLFWGHVAHIKNDVPYFREHIRETLRMTRYTVTQSVRSRDWKLLVISILVALVALSTVFEAEWNGKNVLKDRENDGQ